MFHSNEVALGLLSAQKLKPAPQSQNAGFVKDIARKTEQTRVLHPSSPSPPTPTPEKKERKNSQCISLITGRF